MEKLPPQFSIHWSSPRRRFPINGGPRPANFHPLEVFSAKAPIQWKRMPVGRQSTTWQAKMRAASCALATSTRAAIVRAMNRILLIAAAVILLIAGCGKKEEPPPPPPEVEKAPAKPLPPEPGVEFADPAKQQRYEAHFREFLTKFESPAAGSALWLKMRDGRRIGGRLESVGPDFVLIRATGIVSQVSATDLAMESRAQIFLADFARLRAIERVNLEAAGQPVAEPPRIAVRYALFNDITARIGPGREFVRAAGANFVHGKPVDVLAEFEDWIEVRAGTTNRVWISRFATYDLDELNPAGRKRDVDILQELAVVSHISPETNEAEVNLDAWDLFDSRVHEGIARALAAYCAVVRKNNVMFVTISGKETQVKLGKYSQSFGWRVQEQ